MLLNSTISRSTPELEKLDRFTKLNVLGLLGQSIHELNQGNDQHAALYFITALIAIKSTHLSFALQGILAADRVLGRVAGEQPLNTLFDEIQR